MKDPEEIGKHQGSIGFKKPSRTRDWRKSVKTENIFSKAINNIFNFIIDDISKTKTY